VEDRLRLALGEEVVALRLRGLDLRVGAARAADERLEALERELHERLARRLGVTRGADRLDDEIDLRRGHAEALDDLARGLRLPELVARAPRDDVAAVLDEDGERLLQVEHGGAAAHDGQVDDAE